MRHASESNEDKRYTRAALLKSKRFSHIQKDFLKAILTGESYTLAEAENAIKSAFKGRHD